MLFGFIASIALKVGQLLVVHTSSVEEGKELIEKAHVGGFILYQWANDLSTPGAIQTLTTSLQDTSASPLFFMIDQEGGPISRLPFLSLPAPSQIPDRETAFSNALLTAQTLRSIGINFNLAPVVDVSTSLRCYGSTPEEVTLKASAVCKGFTQGHLLYCLKHFPGHGGASGDSHYTLPLGTPQLAPFISLIHEAPAIMTAHLFTPTLDPLHPATLSYRITTELLRNQLGFQGLIITDSLAMEGFLLSVPDPVEGAIRAFEAGADILLLGGKQLDTTDGFEITPSLVYEIHAALSKAVLSGRISEERLDASIKRINSFKESL